jgi:uncharacterized membrane protein (DUF4010 family)
VNFLSIFFPFALSLLLGALIGLEREFSTKKHFQEDSFAGTRTFSLICLFGSLAVFVDQQFLSGFLLLAFGGIIILSIVSYAISYIKHDEIGITTEVTVMLVFLIGVLTQYRQTPLDRQLLSSQKILLLAIAITVIVLIVLYLKNSLFFLTKKIKSGDIRATLKFAVISVIILPLIDPETSLKISDLSEFSEIWFGDNSSIINLEVINPRNVWLMVTLISGISFLGYIAIKAVGRRKGIGLSGFLGGLISSTATTLAFSNKSKKNPEGSQAFSLAIILACSTMFLRILLEVLVINPNLLPSISISMLVMTFTGVLICLLLWYRTGKEQVDEVPHKNPFELAPALSFGLLYAVIIFVTKLLDNLEVGGGTYIVSIVSGLTDVDPITLTMSQIAKDDPSKMSEATIAITLAAFSNTFLKAGLVFFLGSKKLRWITIGGLAIIVTAGAISLLVI